MTAIPIFSELLAPFKHGFFGRRGGVSAGVYSSLNCRRGSSDRPEYVSKNRQIAVESVGADMGGFATLYQIHSNVVVEAKPPLGRFRPKADAMVANSPGIALGVLTADCMPVLFGDPAAGIVGAAHAGWRGSLSGVLQNTIAAMEELGAEAKRIRAAIGPCISQRNYEVGEEFFDAFVSVNPAFSQYFKKARGGKFLFDLPAFGLDRIRDSGIEDVEWMGECTYGKPEDYFSYRRSRHANDKDFGCQLSVISA